ncbi:MAG: CCA tRNA nucleotidyltransferase [Firmicutes bacterium]|nr:CCA tRNA nucleotidyltransferase [Bacillota bacterium]
MSNLIPLINSALTPEMQGILYFLSSQAGRNSAQIYCAGSFVRDLLLGRENRKLNLLITGSAVDFARQLVSVLPGKLTVYEKLGTATLILSKGFVFDMLTARRDFNPFTTAEASGEGAFLKKELFERDFTINTLACSLNWNTFGELYDFFGGLDDLKKGALKVLYRLSFADNPLRILRLVRFEQRFSFFIEEETKSLLQQSIANNVLNKVSKESLSKEIRLFFTESCPAKILSRLVDLNLFKQLFPRVKLSSELFKRLSCLEGFLQRMKNEKAVKRGNIFLTYLCLLFSELSEHDLHYMCHIMRLKRRERYALLEMMKNRTALKNEEKCLAYLNNLLT